MKSRALFLLALAWGLPCQSVALPEGDLQHQEKADVVFRTLAGWPSNTFDFHNGIYYRFTDSSTGPSNPSDGSRHGIFEMVGLVAQGNVVLSTAGIQEITLLQFKTPTQGPTFYWGGYSLKNTSIPRGLAASPGSTRSAIIATAKSLKNRPVPINYILSPGQAIFPDIYYNYITTSGAGGQFLDVDEIQAMRSDTFTEYCYAANNLQIVRYGSVFLLAEVAYLQTLAAHGGLSPRRQLEYLRASTIDYPAITVFNGTTTVANGGATFLTSLNIRVEDALSGPERLEFSRNGSTIAIVNLNDTTRETTSYLYTSSDISELGSLQNAQYSVRAIDQAGNVTSGEFKVQTGTGPTSGENSRSASVPASQKSTDCFTAVTTDTIAGIESISFSKDGGGYSESADFQCPSVAKLGPFCNLAAGSYTTRIRNCAGTEWTYASTVTAASNSIQICGIDPSGTKTCSSAVPVSAAHLMGTSSFTVVTTGSPIDPPNIGKYCLGMAASAFGIDKSAADCPGGGGYPSRSIEGPASWWAGTSTFRVWNANPGSTQAINVGLEIRVRLYDANGNTESAGLNYILGGSPDYNADPGEGIDGTVLVSEVGQPYPTRDPDGVFKSSPTIKNVQISSETLTSSMWAAIRRRVLGLPTPPKRSAGSEIVFTSTFPFSFTFQDPSGGVQTATSTLKIYRWSGVDWDSTTVAGLAVSKDVGTGVIIASGAMSRTGLYAAMFDGQDSSPPNTAWSIQGSSSGFAGTNFVSTYSYLVVSSTDLAVNGFASGVATTFYRIDGLPGDSYSVYSTSLSFLPGTHWVDSYATDYAGNVSSVTRATITVTAGSVTKLTSSLQVDGNLLVGFLGSGAKAEVVARAEYDYALMVSSVDGRAMLAVDNANFASIGTAPASGRLTLAGVASDTALALRSGNSTATVMGAQLAFGYDGTSDMRHALYTQHGSADYNNKLLFKLWTPATGSSSTLGNLPVLSLEGSSKTASGALVHIMPAGLGENELVVSNGFGLGLGNVLRWERWQPSDSKLKTGIERLGPKDEARAWADLMALKPARYRRKANGPAAPLERGYILEEVPQSLRAGSGISVDERLVTVELALKGAIAEMNALEERLKKLKAAPR